MERPYRMTNEHIRSFCRYQIFTCLFAQYHMHLHAYNASYDKVFRHRFFRLIYQLKLIHS